jgi:zinc transporter
MSVSAAETEALICAVRLHSGETLGLEALAGEPSAATPLWLHFNLLDNRARHYIERCSWIHEEGRALLLSDDARIQAQVFERGFGVILGDLFYDFDADPESFASLRVYVDERLIVTCRRHRVRSVDRVRGGLQAYRELTPFELFIRFSGEIATGFAEVTGDLADTIETAEDRVLAGRWQDQASELGGVRRVLVRLRRQRNGDRAALADLSQHLGDALDADARGELHELIERLDATGQDMDLVADRARLLQEEIASRLSEATNRNLYLLSIVTTALLPVTLVTGIFGMNVGGLPFTESQSGFWWVLLGMGATVVTTMVMLRRSRVR